MLTNAHILAINDRLSAAKQILWRQSESCDKQVLMALIEDITDHLYGISNDMSDDRRTISELQRQLYEPIVQAQADRAPFGLLTDQCYAQNKVDAVEAEMHAACQGTAVGLWKTIRIQEALGYIAARNRTASDIYDMVEERFGKLPYNIRNFRKARNKR